MNARCAHCGSGHLVYFHHDQDGFVLRCADCLKRQKIVSMTLVWHDGNGICGDRCNTGLCQNIVCYRGHFEGEILVVRPHCGRVFRLQNIVLESVD